MRLESIARTRGDENPTAKGRVHAQGEQQALKPIPKESRLAKKMNCGWSAIQTARKGPEQIPKWSCFEKVKRDTGTSQVKFAANQKIEPNSLTSSVLTYISKYAPGLSPSLRRCLEHVPAFDQIPTMPRRSHVGYSLPRAIPNV